MQESTKKYYKNIENLKKILKMIFYLQITMKTMTN